MTFWNSKKRLKIPKGQSEFVYGRRTDNTVAKKRVQKDKQRSTKHTHKTKDRVTRMDRVKNGKLRTYFYNVFKKYIKKKNRI
jgi:hypothetical protein